MFKIKHRKDHRRHGGYTSALQQNLTFTFNVRNQNSRFTLKLKMKVKSRRHRSGRILSWLEIRNATATPPPRRSGPSSLMITLCPRRASIQSISIIKLQQHLLRGNDHVLPHTWRASRPLTLHSH